ncbi:MAG: signal peptidase I [Actinomycetota bacterium]|nr:signal peptidase I [Actinomycetota bacterium]
MVTEAPPSESILPSDGEEPDEPKKEDSFVDFLKELPVLIVVAFGIALLIKTFLLQAFFIPSGSMENTLLIGDRVLVSKFLYKFTKPKYGDVIVFVSPLQSQTPKVDHGPIGNLFSGLSEGLGLKSSERDFIKRVIATEGQTIQIKNGLVMVDNKPLTEPYRFDQSKLPDYGPLTVPKDKIFMMGDNRNNSQDSRVFGPIPKSSVVGRAFVLIWPPGRFTFMSRPHQPASATSNPKALSPPIAARIY